MSRYIDADILISYIRDVGLLGDGYSHDERENNVCDMIEYIKTADVQEVKHRHWIKDPESGITRCSECDWTFEVSWESNYCLNCGVKMYE